jgi:histidyl-tRNA synthetase
VPAHRAGCLTHLAGPSISAASDSVFRPHAHMKFRAVKGFNDTLPAEVGRWQHVESTFRRAAELAGFSEVRTPHLEPTDLFVRSIGTETDVVQKEMYTFERGRHSLTLRPEGTASTARAYVQHKVFSKEPVTRWFYIGPMFRAENVQRGRLRQFHQAGCEVFGDAGPASDAELIQLLYAWFTELGIEDLEVCVSTIGNAESKAQYRDALVAFLEPLANGLSETSQRRLQTNPLRVLDSKAPEDQELLKGAPSILDFLTDEDREHWEELLRQLDALGLPYQIDPGLVRGLDYYTRTLFELKSKSGELGAQNTLAGGGRYDPMVESMGGPAIPAIGFAIGLERVLLAMPERDVSRGPLCVVTPVGAAAVREGLLVARELREHGICVEVDGRGNSLKSMLRRANSRDARMCLLIGESELERGVVQLKDLAQRSQEDAPRAGVASRVAELLAIESDSDQKTDQKTGVRAKSEAPS